MIRAVALVVACLAGVPIGALEFPLPGCGYAHTVDICEGWRFAPDPGDRGADEGWFAVDHDRSEWQALDLPAVWDLEPGTVEVPVTRQVGWYHRRIRIPEGWRGEALVHFLGAQFATDLWVDGRWVGLNLGGYTPFALPLGPAAEPGATVEVVVRVDNRLSKETIPGRHLGWEPYGGITREVYLVDRPTVHVEAFRWRCRVPEEGPASLVVAGRLDGCDSDDARTLTATLAAGDAEVATAACRSGNGRFELELTLSGARLWSPEDPFRHHLTLAWDEGVIELPVGLRQLRIAGDELLLNNRPIWLQGFGIHEEWAGHGPIVPHAERRRELTMLKDQYAINALRPGHYPNHPECYRLCDELGILVFTEIPVWQINGAFLNSDFAWNDWIEPQLEAMVASYGAFTSVVSWGIGNENGAGKGGYHRRGIAWLRERDPSRIPLLVLAAGGHLGVYDYLDMGARNFHYGWYHSKTVYGLRRGYRANHRAAGGKPIWVAEQGAHAVRGRFNGAYNDRSRGSEIYQDQVIRFGFQYAATRPGIAGISPWSWADFHRNGRTEAHGLTDLQRRPKLACSTLRNLMGGGPVRLFAVEDTSVVAADGRLLCRLFAFQSDPDGRARTGWQVRWWLRRGQDTLTHGTRTVDIGNERVRDLGEVEWRPGPRDRGFHSLWLELRDAEGAWIHTNAVHFGVGEQERPGVLQIPPLGPDAWLAWGELRIPVHPHPGLAIPLAEGPHEFRLHVGARSCALSVEVVSGRATRVEPDALDWAP